MSGKSGKIGIGSAAELGRLLRGGGVFADCPLGLTPHELVVLRDDFHYYVTADLWTSALTATGSVAVGDAANGVLALTCKAEDNAYAQAASTNEVFKFAVNKRLWFESLVKVTEADTNKQSIFVGLSDTLAMPQNDGGALPASYDGAGFGKVEGGTTLSFETSNAATQETTDEVATVTSAQWMRLGFKVEPDAAGTTATVTAFVNGVAVAEHTLTLTGLEEMHVVFGNKASSAAAEKLEIDWVMVAQER